MHLLKLITTLNNLPHNISFEIKPNGIVLSTIAHPVPVVSLSNKYDIEINGGPEKYGQWEAVVGCTKQPGYTGAVLWPSEEITAVMAQRLYRLSRHSSEQPVTFLFAQVRDEDSTTSSGKWCILRLKNTETSTPS